MDTLITTDPVLLDALAILADAYDRAGTEGRETLDRAADHLWRSEPGEATR